MAHYKHNAKNVPRHTLYTMVQSICIERAKCGTNPYGMGLARVCKGRANVVMAW